MKLIFINTLPTSKIFGKKVNAWWFSENGFDVEFWDCAPLFWSNDQLMQYYGGADDYRYIGPNHQTFTDNIFLINTLKKLEKGTSIFYLSRNLYKHVDDDWLLKMIQSLDMTLYFQGFDTHLLPTTLLQMIKNNFRTIKHKYLNRSIHPNIFFGCGSHSKKMLSKVYKNCNFVSISSPKIDWSLKKRILEKEYIVFVDEGLEYAPDAKILGFEIITDITGYYKRMNSIFDQIEKWTGIPIIIAASGKYEYQQNVFNRQILYGKTFELMEYSSLILGHFSSALDYNLKVKKPIIQFDDISFTKYSRKVFQSSFPLFGKKPIMTHKFNKNIFDKEFIRETNHYDMLVNQYFKEEGIGHNYLEILAKTFRENQKTIN